MEWNIATASSTNATFVFFTSDSDNKQPRAQILFLYCSKNHLEVCLFQTIIPCSRFFRNSNIFKQKFCYFFFSEHSFALFCVWRSCYLIWWQSEQLSIQVQFKHRSDTIASQNELPLSKYLAESSGTLNFFKTQRRESKKPCIRFFRAVSIPTKRTWVIHSITWRAVSAQHDRNTGTDLPVWCVTCCSAKKTKKNATSRPN